MTEAEWLASADSAAMLQFLTGPNSQVRGTAGYCHTKPPLMRISERKLRLFACACARWMGMGNQQVLDHIEDCCDQPGFTTWQEILTDYLIPGHRWCCQWVERSVTIATAAEKAALLRDIIRPPFRPRVPGPCSQFADGCNCPLCYVWRGLLTWSDSTIPRLAERIYQDRDFSLLPYLYDALLEAGCDNEEMLAHARGMELCGRCLGSRCAGRTGNRCDKGCCSDCNRSGWVAAGKHVRGCWLVDLLTGRE